MSTTILFATSAAGTAAAVTGTLAEIESVPTPVLVGSAAQLRLELGNRDDVAVVLVDRELDASGLDLAREVVLGNPLVAVLLVTDRVDAELLSTALDVGARGVLSLPPSVEEYGARLHTALSWAASARRSADGDQTDAGRTVGRIVAVVGAKGGVGTSTLAVLAARECARRGRTCLVDLDVRQGDLATYCQVRVRRTLADLISVAAEAGGREISEVTYPVRHGVSLLPAPEHGELGEVLTEVAARQVIQALRYQYDRVVIDCGSHLDEGLAAALDLADEIVVVATPDTPALRSVRRLTESMDRLNLGRGTPVHLLLNRANRRAEIQASSAEKLAGLPILVEVADVGTRLDGPVNTTTFLDIEDAHLVAGAKAVASLAIAPEPAAPPGAPRRQVSQRRARGTAVPARRGRRSRRQDENGQVATEGAVVLMIASVLLFLCVELVLVGASALLAHGAAEEAARDYAVGMSQSEVQASVADRLPAALGDGLTISAPSGSSVEVSITLPGMVAVPTPSATAQILWER